MESLIIVDMAIDSFFDTMGKRVRILRDDRKMNQTEMANRMGQFGQKVDPSYLSQIERGDKMPSLPVFKAIVQVLESTADYLLLLTDDPEVPEAKETDTWSETTLSIMDIVDVLPDAKRQEILSVVQAMAAYAPKEESALGQEPTESTRKMYDLLSGNGVGDAPQPKKRRVKG